LKQHWNEYGHDYRSFRRRVFAVCHLHWYRQTTTTKRQFKTHTKHKSKFGRHIFL